MASNNDITIVDAMYDEIQVPARKEAGILLQATAMTAEFDRLPRSASSDIHLVLEDDRGLLVRTRQAVSDRDIAAELQAASDESECEDQDMMNKVDRRSVGTSDPGDGLDALISF